MKPPRRTLVLDYADFWPRFDKEDKWLTGVLRKRFDLQLSPTPDVLIYSVYGRAHRDYRCTRLLLSWENRAWGFSSCDFAMTSDYHRSHRHRRLPLWVAWLDQIPRATTLDDRQALARGFAAIVTPNAASPTRERIHGLLETCGPVASGGRHRNNVGGPVPDKLAFISGYKFSVACENSSHPGYTTEKLFQSLACQTIPIYWGDPCVDREFNPKRFVTTASFGPTSSSWSTFTTSTPTTTRTFKCSANHGFVTARYPRVRTPRVCSTGSKCR